MSFEKLVEGQRRLLERPAALGKELSPFFDIETTVSKRALDMGEKAIRLGKAGCIIAAGGQGSRLKFEGPKGCFPLNAEGLTLFELFSKRASLGSCPLAIMTSPSNHLQTTRFFQEKNYFELDPGRFSFFEQGELPLLSEQGEPLFKEDSKPFLAPNGNGDCFRSFYRSGIWERWRLQGIEAALFLQVDNALADPLDAELIGLCLESGSDLSMRCLARKDPYEKMGLLVSEEGALRVVEYSEFPEEEFTARGKRGSLKYLYANISYFCFCMDFLQKMAEVELPLHLAFKEVNYLDKKVMAWKFETFIFDCLPYASRARLLLTPKGVCFAPLKEMADKEVLEELLKKQLNLRRM